MPEAFSLRTKQKNHQSPNSSAASGPYDLGVLFVHGIGNQAQGDTLVRWGEALLDWIRSVNSNPHEETNVAVLEASLGAGQDKPAEADVEVTINGESRRWLMTEAWWATAFATPSYSQLVVWSLKIVPWALGLHFARYLRSQIEAFGSPDRGVAHADNVGANDAASVDAGEASDDVTRSRAPRSPALTKGLRLVGDLLRLVFAGAALIVGMLLSPLLLLFLLLLLLIGLIPIPQLRTFVNAIQQGLAGSVGDSMVLLENPIQSAAIRSQLRDSLQELASKCRQVALVAHSQGAQIAVETLLKTPPIKKKKKSERWPPPELTTLITFGAGVNKLGLLQYLRERETSHSDAKNVGLGHPLVVTAFLLVLSIFLVLIYRDLMAGNLELSDFWPFPYVLVIGPVCLLLSYLVRYTAMKVGASEPLANRIKMVTVVVIFLIATGVVVRYAKGEIIFFWGALVYALLTLNAFVQFSKSAETKIPAHIAFLEHWYDFYGSADPVPNGPIPNKQKDPSVEICNVKSMLSDHTLYWKNQEEFVGPVAARLAEITGTSFRTFYIGSKELEVGRVRRRIRVGWLRFARWAVIIAAGLYATQKVAALYATQKVATAGTEAKNNLGLNELGRPLLDFTHKLLTSSRLTSWIVLPLPEKEAEVIAGLATIATFALVIYWLLLGTWMLWDAYAKSNFSRSHTEGRGQASLSALEPYFLYLWVPLLLCVVGLPFLIEETVIRILYLFKETGPSYTESIIGRWLLFVFAGWILAWLVMKGLLPGRPDSEANKVPYSK
jgi:hypothetical protein